MTMTKPLAIYYEVLNFMPSSLAMLRDRFELAVFPDPDHADPAVQARAEAVFAPKGFALDAAALSRHPVLRAIGTPTTGELHIDVNAARVRGVTVCSLKHEHELLRSISCTAELAWGMVLCLTRHLPEAWTMFLEGRWEGRNNRCPHSAHALQHAPGRHRPGPLGRAGGGLRPGLRHGGPLL
jgi:D-3-phosphoglycerate dehydrogenase